MTAILMYHAISDSPEENTYTVTKSTLENHFQYLCDNNLNCKTISQYVNEKQDSGVVITFDDGDESNFTHALPVLKKFNLQATFFLTTDFMGRPGYMSWDQVKKLSDENMDIGTHGHTHSFLDSSDASFLNREIHSPLECIKNNIGLDVRHMSLPGGRFKKNTIKQAKASGYLSVSTSIPGSCSIAKDDPAILNRYVITANTSLETFIKIVNDDPRYSKSAAFSYKGKRIAKKMLGNTLYQRLWELKNK